PARGCFFYFGYRDARRARRIRAHQLGCAGRRDRVTRMADGRPAGAGWCATSDFQQGSTRSFAWQKPSRTNWRLLRLLVFGVERRVNWIAHDFRDRAVREWGVWVLSKLHECHGVDV